MAYIDDTKILVVAKRHVAHGEELSIAYVDTDLTTAERKEELKDTYGFECTCAKCEPPKPPLKAPKTPRSPIKAAAAGGKRKAQSSAAAAAYVEGRAAKKPKKRSDVGGCVVC